MVAQPSNEAIGISMRTTKYPRIQRLIASTAKAGVAFAFIALLALVAPRATHPQSAPPAPRQLPQWILYEQVFKQVVFLDIRADAADQAGRDGSKLRNYYQVKAGLTTAEAALLKARAHAAVTELQTVNRQISSAVITFRAQLPSRGKLSAKAPLPPPSPELQALQHQRDKIMLDGVAALQAGMGADRFRNLDAFVQRELAPRVSLTTPKPRARAAAGHPSLPLQPVPWN